VTDVVDLYYHIDLTHPSFNAAKSDARAEHVKNAPRTNLSITENVAGTEGIMKIRAKDETYSPGWANAPFVIKRYTRKEHPQMIRDLGFYGPDWQAGDKR